MAIPRIFKPIHPWGGGVVVISRVLVSFSFRLTFGIALAMSITPSRWVAPGFFRVLMWILLGLNTLAAVAVGTNRPAYGEEWLASLLWSMALADAVALAVMSYLGSVFWLCEKLTAGRGLIAALVPTACLGCLVSASDGLWHSSQWLQRILITADVVLSGALMGLMVASMLLGHYYLNWPGMKLAPLQRLVQAVFLAALTRGVVAASGLCSQYALDGTLPRSLAIFVVFRWIAGILAPMLTAAMAGATLRIPNTQSATGILYAGVVLTFLGELLSQLLATYTRFPI